MKILSFSHDEKLYGAQRSLVGLLRGLRKLGHEITLAVPATGDLAQAAENAGICPEVITYPYPSTKPLRAVRFLRRYPRAARKIRELVADINPHVVHFNTAACIAPALALRKISTPRLWHLRETVPQRWLLARFIKRWSDAIIFNCHHIAESYPLLQKLKKSSVVHNGLDVSRPSDEEIEAIRREFSWQKSDITVTFAGQLQPHKDPMAVLDAVALVRDRGIMIKGCIAGDGPLMPALQKAIERLDLNQVVTLPGFRSDALSILAASNIVVCPSLREPFPRVVLEAMALGLPVVASSVGGIPELVVDGKTGLLVPPGNRQALADALIQLARDREKRLAYCKAGMERHKEFFSEEVYAAGVERVLENTISRKNPKK